MKWLVALCAALAGIAAGMWSGNSSNAPSASQVTVAAAAPQPLAERSSAVAQILTALRGKPGLQQFAMLAEPLSRLTGAEMGEVLERVERDSRESTEYRVGGLFKWWLDRDPDAASAWALPRLKLLAQDGPLAFQPGGSDSTIVQAWGKRFPEKGLELARAYPRSGVAASLLWNTLEKARANPPGDGWVIIREFPDGDAKAQEVPRFLEVWAKKDVPASFAAAQSLAPGSIRDQSIRALLPLVAATDAALAFEEYNKLRRPDSELLTKIITGAASTDPAGMAAWLLKLEPAQFAQAAPWLVDKWAAQDPAAALTWALANGAALSWRGDDNKRAYRHTPFGRITSITTSEKGPDPLGTAITKHPSATLAWLHALPPGPQRDGIAERLLTGAGIDDALKLFGELRQSAQELAAFSIAQKLAKDPKRAIDWASSLPTGTTRENAWISFGQNATPGIDPPKGPDRDAWLRGKVFAPGILNSGPEVSLSLVLEINNLALRRQAFDGAMESYSRQPSTTEKAREWMESANLPEAWKAKWRKE